MVQDRVYVVTEAVEETVSVMSSAATLSVAVVAETVSPLLIFSEVVLAGLLGVCVCVGGGSGLDVDLGVFEG